MNAKRMAWAVAALLLVGALAGLIVLVPNARASLPPAAPAFVGSAHATAFSSPATAGITLAVGNSAVVFVYSDGTGGTYTVSDSAGNPYSFVNTYGFGSYANKLKAFYTKAVSGATTVSAAVTGSLTDVSLMVDVYSNVDNYSHTNDIVSTGGSGGSAYIQSSMSPQSDFLLSVYGYISPNDGTLSTPTAGLSVNTRDDFTTISAVQFIVGDFSWDTGTKDVGATMTLTGTGANAGSVVGINLLTENTPAFIDASGNCDSSGQHNTLSIPQTYVKTGDYMVVFIQMNTETLGTLSDGGNTFSQLSDVTSGYGAHNYIYGGNITAGRGTLWMNTTNPQYVCWSFQIYRNRVGNGAIHNALTPATGNRKTNAFNITAGIDSVVAGAWMGLAQGNTVAYYRGYFWGGNTNAGGGWGLVFNGSASGGQTEIGVTLSTVQHAQMFGLEIQGPQITPPTLTTDAATGIQRHSATLNANLIALGTATTVTRGFYWGTDANPALDNNVSKGTTATPAPYSHALSFVLSPGVLYYFQAWADGSGAGGLFTKASIRSFTALANPTVSTSAATSINFQGAQLQGNLASVGGCTLPVSRGFRYGPDSTFLWNVSVGTTSTPGTFGYAALNLRVGAEYQFEAWAACSFTGESGTFYFFGSILTFFTLGPRVTTEAPTGILPDTATLHGTLSVDSCVLPVTVGFFWGTSPSGLTGHNTTVGTLSSNTSFSYALPSFHPATVYMFAAWAICTVSGSHPFAQGGNETINFPALVTTLALKYPHLTDFFAFGVVNYSGSAIPLTYGFRLCADSACVTVLSNITVGTTASSPLSFVLKFSNLTANTTYYVQAWGWNGIAHVSGAILSIRTLPPSPLTGPLTDYLFLFGILGLIVIALVGAYGVKRWRDNRGGP